MLASGLGFAGPAVRFRRLRPLLFLTFAAACSSSSPIAATPDVHGGTPTSGATLRFDDTGTLLAKPSIDVPLTLFASAGITHATLTLVGAYEDASLQASDIPLAAGATESTGGTTLRTPSVAATFTVRASAAGAPDVLRRVSVSAQGFATLRITPSYTGVRVVDPFVASTFVQRTCASLLAAPVADGALVESGGVTGPIVIDGVPADGHVAVLVRGAHYASGCVDVDDLVPLGTRDVGVSVYDLPLALTATYATTFTFEPEGVNAAAWQATFDDAATEAADAFAYAVDAAGDGPTLLDAIRDRAVPAANRTQLETARNAGQWDTKAGTWLMARPPSLHDRAVAWLTKGRAAVAGPVTATLSPGATKGHATVTPLLYGALPAAAAKLTADDAFDWTADSEDTVHLSGGITFVPSAVLTGAADAVAAQGTPAAANVGAAIASQIDCTGLATSLVGTGVAYPQCASACLALHCANAVAALWSDAAAAAPALRLTMTASGRARVVDTPEPASFDGAWVGDATSSSQSFSMKGRASGAHP